MHTIVQRMPFRAAWLYYGRVLRQDDVAKQLGVSRASVASYLKQAREDGLVRIQMAVHSLREQELALELETRYGLSAAYVVPQSLTAGDALGDVARHSGSAHQ